MDWTAQIESAAQTGDPDERRAKLLVLREGPEAALGRIDHYLADDDLRREAETMEAETRHALARHNATIREELLRRGEADEATLDESGMLSHEVLDDLEEEGLLEAALAELYPLSEGIGNIVGIAKKFDTKLHPHSRESGQFTKTFGHVFTKKDKPRVKGRGGNVKHPTPTGPKPPKPPPHPGARERKLDTSKVPGTETPKLETPEGGVGASEIVQREKGQSEANKAKAESLGQRLRSKLSAATRGRQLQMAEAHFNPAGSVSQHTLLAFARDAGSKDDTFDKYARVQPDGTVRWSSARRKIHEAIIDALLREPIIDENGDLHMDPNGKYLEPDADGVPKVMFSGGGYAAGKGASIKLARKQGRVPQSAITLDPDRIKAMLPEYKQALDEDDPEGNLQVYREAWEIAQELQRRAQAKRLNMIVDGISDTSTDEIRDRVRSFSDAGYGKDKAGNDVPGAVNILYTDIPTQEALNRAAGRAAGAKADADRRHIPEVVMRAVHRDVAATIPDFMQRLADEHGKGATGLPHVTVYDNDQGFDLSETEVGKDGQPKKLFRPPKPYAEFDPTTGEFKVIDQALWQKLQAKAQEKIEGVDARPRHPAR
jgi:hypothetical protein